MLITMTIISVLLLLFSIGFSILIDGIFGFTLTTITVAAFFIFGATSIKLFRMHKAFFYDGKESFMRPTYMLTGSRLVFGENESLRGGNCGKVLRMATGT